jgi:hypothetical protein
MSDLPLLEFTVNGRALKAEKMNAMKQFKLSRKLAPLLLALAPLFLKMSDLFKEAAGKKGLSTAELVSLMELGGPFSEELAKMEDEAADEVWNLTLGSVKVETSPNTWMPLWNVGASSASMIEFNDVSILLPIILQVVQFNLSDFIFGALMNRGAPEIKSSGGASPMRKIG